MPHIAKTIIALLLLTWLVASCKDSDKPEPSATTPAGVADRLGEKPAIKPVVKPAEAQIKVPFREPMEPAVYELPSQALATWREFAAYRPVLVLFSTHPMLAPIPPERMEPIVELFREGSREDVVQRARMLTANPAILPPSTVTAAIANNFFSELVVVLPTTQKPEEVSLDSFREKALRAGFLSEDEAGKLQLNDGTISGTVRGIPLRIPHPDKLPKISQPIVLHVDLGFFKDMYVNEVKTPSYDLLYQLASNLKDAAYPTLAATLSFSNQEVGFSLESRFLIRDLATVLRQPQLLGGKTPVSWTLRSQALYATAMFSESRARELTAQAVQATPDDAAAHYALALDMFRQNHSTEGFAALDRAVSLDRGYGLEYLELAERGQQMGKTDKSIDLMRKAAQVLPDNPLIRRRLAEMLLESGRAKEARPLIAELRQLEWSSAFYPYMPYHLKQMADAAAVDVITPKTPSTLPPKDKTTTKPAERMPGFNHMGTGPSGR